MDVESTTLKFCKDCKHGKHGKRDWLFGWQFAKCKAHVVSNVDLVSGISKPVYLETYCEVQRRYEGNNCGAGGRLFEPKQKGWW